MWEKEVKKCDNCIYYNWYYNWCKKWKCEKDERSVCIQFINEEKGK